ncbi:MAG: phosphomannomutase/phosphoglucomutase [Candidatus Aenigmarchaeota archaeon]|nr:phosphomannomutase/phosphoglucomutase [Candidatus Aenigmarchaeota archaeon]
MGNDSLKNVSSIFRSYDIRGVVGQDLTPEIMHRIGQAFGSYIHQDIVLGRDVRLHSQKLKEAFVKGFLSSGFSIEDAGMLPLGAGMYHAWQEKKTYAYITGSHLPKEWNGIKFFHANGIGFIDETNREIRDTFFKGKFIAGSGKCAVKNPKEIVADYKNFLLSKVRFHRATSVVLDCGNGCAGLIVPELFREAGLETRVVFGEIDGTFPNRLPDPQDFALAELKKNVVEGGFDLGIAYDGDGDRTALVDDKGSFTSPEETSYLILSELLKTQKGDIVANVECTKAIDLIAGKFGRKVIRVPVGHTFLMDAVHRHNAVFGVESAAHYCLPHFIPFDDATIVGLYAAYILSERGEKLSEFKKQVPKYPFARVSFECPDRIKFGIIKTIAGKAAKEFKNVNTMDGLRVDLENGWALLRASNTSPYIRLTVEGVTEKDKNDIQKMFLDYLKEEMEKHGLELVPEHK